jgi:aminopeptidase N
MEFPMMVNDDDTETWESTVYLTSHEISHTYFPFYMGINERKYAWMDEGFAVYLPEEFQSKMQRFAPDNAKRDTSRSDSRAQNVKSYLRNAGTMNDVPMIAPSSQLRSPSYRHNAYNKAALVYDILKDMLGKEKFDSILKEYINRWNGKHPTPYDFFNTFNDVSGENLDWFWQKWFMMYGYTDLRINSVIQNDNNIEITVVNTGRMPVPVELSLYDTDNNVTVISRNVSVWKLGDTLVIKESVNGKIQKVVLGNKYVPDLNPSDNELNIEWK